MIGSGQADRVWFVRHGQTEDNLRRGRRTMSAAAFNRIVEDSAHAALTAEGREQVEHLVPHFTGLPLDVVHASPLPRAQETARIISGACGLDVVTVEGLRELVPTRLEPVLMPGRRHPTRTWYISSLLRQFVPVVPVYESVWSARGRVWRAWKEVLSWRPSDRGDGRNCRERLIVAHHGTLLLLLSVLIWSGEWRVVRWSGDNAGITEVVRR